MDVFDSYLAKQLDQVDWIPFSGPLCQRPGAHATHMGYATVGPYLMKVYQLSNGERVFDADDAERVIGGNYDS